MAKKLQAALASRGGIFWMSLTILILTLAVSGEQIWSQSWNESLMLNLQALALENDISLLFVAYGVLLEERSLFLTKGLGAAVALSPLEERRSDQAETAGAYLLMLGLVLEVIDQAFDLISSYSSIAATGLSLLVGLFNLLAVIVLVRLLKQILTEWSNESAP